MYISQNAIPVSSDTVSQCI